MNRLSTSRSGGWRTLLFLLLSFSLTQAAVANTAVTDCTQVSITTDNGSLVITGLDGAPVTSLQIFSSTWATVFSCFADCPATKTMAVPADTYHVYVKYYSAAYQQLCVVQETVTVTGGGGGGGGGNACPLNLDATVSNITCNDNGTAGDPSDDTFTFDVLATGGNPWGYTAGNFTGDFGQTATFGPFPISGGTVSLTIVDNDNPECTVNVTANPPATCSNNQNPCNGQGGDSDGDGVCDNQDCQPNNPAFPATPGSSCNDGNPNTTNDVVDADGCGCTGTPTGGGGGTPDCANIDITTPNGKIKITGLDGAPISSVQIFNSSWGTEFQCFADCGAMYMDNYAAGTYYVYVKYFSAGYQQICVVNETVTVTAGGGGGGGNTTIDITCPNNITVTAAPGANGKVVNYNLPTATTTCAGGTNLVLMSGPASGSTFPIGTTTVTYKATNNCSQAKTCSFTVTVNQGQQTNLNINCPANITRTAAIGASGKVVNYTIPTATTNCPGGAQVTKVSGPNSGATFPIGTTTVTYKATNGCGQQKTCSFTVTVNANNNANLTLDCPAQVNRLAAPGENTALVNYVTPTATTNCPGGAQVTLTAGLASGSVFPVGATTVSYEATNGCGQMETCTFVVTVTANGPAICDTRTVNNTKQNCGTGEAYAFYGLDLLNNTNANEHYRVVNGEFKEFVDGTARFTGTLINQANSGIRWSADVTFGGRTGDAPAGSPKSNACSTAGNNNDYYYYTTINGTLTGTQVLAGAQLSVTRKGEAFQIGTGANLQDHDKYGASGWLMYTIVSQPTSAVHITNNGALDFNFRLSGGQPDCPVPTTPGCDVDVIFFADTDHLNNSDGIAKHLLEQLGYHVTVESDEDAGTSDLNGKELIVISSTVHSGTLNGNLNLKHTQIPIITWESYLFDNYHMTGYSANHDYGSTGNQKWTWIDNANHPLAAGYTGDIQVYTSNDVVRWGKPNNNAARVARLPGSNGRYMVYGYDTGAEMVGGFHAPAKRIGFFTDNHTFSKLTNKGKDLFKAAAIWATGCGSLNGNLVAANQDLLRLNASQELHEVQLAWSSNLGYVTTHYEVEHRTANGDWAVIDERTNARDNADIHYYRAVDTQPAIGVNYYRVRAHFRNGQSRLTEERAVVYNELADYAVFPNPTHAELFVNLESVAGKAVTITSYDALGQVIRRDQVDEATATPHRIPVQDWQEGTYYLRIQADGLRAVGQKVQVIHH